MVDGAALKPLKAGIVGLGNVAWRYDVGRDGSTLTHLSTYKADERFRLVGGYDPEPTSRADFTNATGIDSHDSLDALLAQSPDIISICSPNRWHGEHLRACLEARVPMIWLEKPATDSARDALELLALQRSLDSSTVLVGFQRRYQPVYQRLRAEFSEVGPESCAGISVTYSRGLETNGVHLIDFLFQLVGNQSAYDLLGVSGAQGQNASPSFILRFADGPTCIVTGLDLPYHSIDITVHLTTGRHSVIYGGARAVREDVIENPLYPGFYRLQCRDCDDDVAGVLDREAQAVFPAMLSDLVNAYEKGREPASSLSTAVASQLLVDRVLALARGEN